MENKKQTKRIQFTMNELEVLEYHLGNELEAYIEMLSEHIEKDQWEDVYEWKQIYNSLTDVYHKIIIKNGLTPRWRMWYDMEFFDVAIIKNIGKEIYLQDKKNGKI